MTKHESKRAGSYANLRGFHRAVPIVLFAVAVFLVFCFITHGRTGSLGGFISGILLGLFSWGGYAIPALLLLHAVFYASDVARGTRLTRLIFSCVALLSLSTLAYAVTAIGAQDLTLSPASFYRMGQATVGGGFVGGILGYAIIRVLGTVGLFILAGMALALYAVFFFAGKNNAPRRLLYAGVMALTGAISFFGKKIRGASDRSKETRSRRQQQAQQERDRELYDDDFFVADNGMSQLAIAKLDIHETRDERSMEENPTLHEHVHPKYSVDSEEPTVRAKQETPENTRFSYGRPTRNDNGDFVYEATPEPAEEPTPAPDACEPAASAFTESAGLRMGADDSADATFATATRRSRNTPTGEVNVRRAAGLDEPAGDVFTKDFDPFDLTINEKLAGKPSGKAPVAEDDFPTVSEYEPPINEYPAQQRARQREEFERRRALRAERERTHAAQATAPTPPPPQPTPGTAPAATVRDGSPNPYATPFRSPQAPRPAAAPGTSLQTQRTMPAPTASGPTQPPTATPPSPTPAPQTSSPADNIEEVAEDNAPPRPAYTNDDIDALLARGKSTVINGDMPEGDTEEQASVGSAEKDGDTPVFTFGEDTWTDTPGVVGPEPETAPRPEAGISDLEIFDRGYDEIPESVMTDGRSVPEYTAGTTECPPTPEQPRYTTIILEAPAAPASSSRIQDDTVPTADPLSVPGSRAAEFADQSDPSSLHGASQAEEADAWGAPQNFPACEQNTAPAEMPATQVPSESNATAVPTASSQPGSALFPPSCSDDEEPQRSEESRNRYRRATVFVPYTAEFSTASKAPETPVSDPAPVRPFRTAAERMENEPTIFPQPVPQETERLKVERTVISPTVEPVFPETEPEVAEEDAEDFWEGAPQTPPEEDGFGEEEEIPESEQNPVVIQQRGMFDMFRDDTDPSRRDPEPEVIVEEGGEPIIDGDTQKEDEDETEEDADQGDFEIEEDVPPFDDAHVAKPKAKAEPAKDAPDYSHYKIPPVSLLKEPVAENDEGAAEECQHNSDLLTETLMSFNVKTSIKGFDRGPRITRYEVVPARGVKVSQVTNLFDDISLALAAEGIRMEAPIPGEPAIGFEIPNKHPTNVLLRKMIESAEFLNSKSKTFAAIGEDVTGNPVFFDIAKAPHLLIAGATGMGKSVCMNSILISMLFKARPDELKLIMVDPKKVEFKVYNGIPHLLVPVVTEVKQAAGALAWAVEEMERRYDEIEKLTVRNLDGYNEKVSKDPSLGKPMPKIIIVIDELNDLMVQARDPVENLIMRIAQKARAAGIHLIIGTQRPSVNVITGTIKANIPSRISCKVSSSVDSRTILEQGGAEKLLDKGDMLFAPVGKPKPLRVQGAFVSDTEVEEIMNFLKSQSNGNSYDDSVLEEINRAAQKCVKSKGPSSDEYDDEEDDESNDGYYRDKKFLEAVNVVIQTGKASTSLIQRRISVGYGKAAKYIDIMQDLGVVGEPNGQKPREILITLDEWKERLTRYDAD